MQDVIDRSGDIDKLGDIVLDDPEAGIGREVAQIDGGASHHVVDRKNIPAAIDETVAKMGPQKSSAARDYRAQRDGPLLTTLTRGLYFFMIACFVPRLNPAVMDNFAVILT